MALFQILAIHGNRIRLVFVVGHLEFTNVVPILCGSVIDNRIEVGPTRKLTVPMGDRRERGHDEEGPCPTQFSCKGIDENCSLDCLTQTHLRIIFCVGDRMVVGKMNRTMDNKVLRNDMTK